MTSEAMRDPVTDHLLTSQNSALIIIDYQPTQLQTVRSADSRAILRSIILTAKIARAYKLPVVLSTVNVNNGVNEPTVPELSVVLDGVVPIDRTSINAWEDVEFKRAVQATGRKKLIIAALWTEVCLVFPALDALREGYEVYPIVDAVGGTSLIAHEAGLERQYQAGAKPTSVAQLACELQRDWGRPETVHDFAEILTSIEADMREPAVA
jgi:nicotinamidase-related amidase